MQLTQSEMALNGSQKPSVSRANKHDQEPRLMFLSGQAHSADTTHIHAFRLRHAGAILADYACACGEVEKRVIGVPG